MNMTRATKMSPDLETALPPIVTNGRRPETDTMPTANYSKLSEKLRKSTNPQLQCSMFCGGRRCKYECSDSWKEDEKTIPGHYSHWVTDDILAMARPNMESIQRYNLIEVFREHNIKSIINLQEPGEHASCGNSLTSSGFSYDPTCFMDNDIYFYNFQWKDYSIVSEESLLDMVKVMTFALTEGKVAIHCHAGLGRTGVLIASYLVYTLRCKPQDAIKYVRSKRPQSIQTRGQILSVLQFAQYVVPFFVVYPHIIHRQSGLTLMQLLYRQRLLLHGYELRHLKYIPKILYVICERLLKLCGRHKAYSPGIAPQTSINKNETAINFQLECTESFCKYFFSAASPNITLHREERPASNMTIQLSSGIMSPETALTDISSSPNVSRDNTADSKRPNRRKEVILPFASTSNHCSSLPPVEETNDKFLPLYSDIDFINAPMHQISLVGLDTPKKSRTNSSTSSSDDHSSESPCESLTSLIEKTLGYHMVHVNSSHVLYDQQTENCKINVTNYNNSYLLEDQLINDELQDNGYYNDLDQHSISAPCSSGFMSANCTEDEYIEILDRFRIMKTLSANYNAYSKPFKSALTKYQRELNDKQSGWEKLSQETNVEMLCALMWTWLENLRDPVLNKNSLCYIVIKAEKPLEALIKLDNNIRYTVEYLLRFLARLKPDDLLLDDMLREFMAILTKQSLKTKSGTLVPTGKDWPEMRKGTAGRVMLFANGIYRLLDRS